MAGGDTFATESILRMGAFSWKSAHVTRGASPAPEEQPLGSFFVFPCKEPAHSILKYEDFLFATEHQILTRIRPVVCPDYQPPLNLIPHFTLQLQTCLSSGRYPVVTCLVVAFLPYSPTMAGVPCASRAQEVSSSSLFVFLSCVLR